MFKGLRIQLGLRFIDWGMRLACTRTVAFNHGRPVVDKAFEDPYLGRRPLSWVEEAHIRAALLDDETPIPGSSPTASFGKRRRLH